MFEPKDSIDGVLSAPRRVNRRRFLEMAGAAAVTTVAAACTPGASSGSTSNSSGGGFTIMNYFTTEDDPATQAVFAQASADFETKHPGVKMNQIIMSPDDVSQRIITGLRVGQQIDIFELQAFLVQELLDSLYPLDSLFSAIGSNEFGVGSRMQVNGHDWAFPYGGSAFNLWVRKDLVGAPPTTLDELKAAAARATTGGRFGLDLVAGGAAIFGIDFPAIIWAHGGDYFDRKGNVIFGSDQVRQAIQDYVDLLKFAPPGNANATTATAASDYASGRVAMDVYGGRLGINTAHNAPQLAAVTTVAPTPYGPQDIHTWRWSYVGVGKKSVNPELAVEFLKLLFTGANGIAYANSVPGQLFSSIKSVRDASLANPSNDYGKQHQDWLQTIVSQVDHGNQAGTMGWVETGTLKKYNDPPAPWSGSAWGTNPVDMQMIQKIVLQGMSVADGHTWATNQLTSIVKDYKSSHPNWKPPA
jgi:multiple sugar transport system substrate-binding protein